MRMDGVFERVGDLPQRAAGLCGEITTTRTWLMGPEKKGRTEEPGNPVEKLVVSSNGVRKPKGGDGIRKWEYQD